MFERFTDRARRVVVLAQEEARLLNHNYIGTEHLLLGLLREEQGMAAHALESLGMSLDVVRAEVLEIIGIGELSPSGHIPFTPRAKKVLELSLREALQLGTDYIGTEHLLLGLIREGEGVAAQILVKLGNSLSGVREAVIAIYEQNPSAFREQPPEPVTRSGSASNQRGETATDTEQPSGGGSRLQLPGFLQGRRMSYRPATAPAAAVGYAAGLGHAPVRSAEPVHPRQPETERLLAALIRREHNNVLLVGASGAGKSALVRGLVQTLAANQGPAALSGAEVVQLGLGALRAGAERLVRRRTTPIVLVEDLDLLLQADESTSGRLVVALSSVAEAEEPLIVTATPQACERLASALPTLAARFEQVEVPAADEEVTAAILQLLRPTLQEFHKITIEDAALTAAVELAQAAPGGRVLPGGAVDLLDAAAARLAVRPRDESDAETAVLREEDLRTAA
jgi:ATP-dependent Clp protease ATP-binding subunit ClpC